MKVVVDMIYLYQSETEKERQRKRQSKLGFFSMDDMKSCCTFVSFRIFQAAVLGV